MARDSLPRRSAAAALAALAAGLAPAAPGAGGLASDPAAVAQLVEAVSLDVMSEASLDACGAMGTAAYPQMRAAWVAWRERHQLAPLRVVVNDMRRRGGSSAPAWDQLTAPMRQRVLADAAPEQLCAGLARDWQGTGMDVGAQYPQARAVAAALVQAGLASRPELPAIAPGTPRGQVLQPSQLPALVKQRGSWSAVSEATALQKLGTVYVKGRVARWGSEGKRFQLVQEDGERRARHTVNLGFNAEPWVGREVVLRGVFTSLSGGYAELSAAALVGDPSGLTPAPLAHEPLARKEVLLQRVTRAPGQGLADKDLAAIVIHGQSNFNNGTRWEEDVRFLLRDGTAYRRTEMPPDQLDVPASRQLEPQQWGRWRSTGQGYEMQDQDDDGRPNGWKAHKHHAVKPWPPGTRLEGSFSRGSFSGSLVTGGTSSRRGIRFTKDGRFERSYSSLSSSGTLAATLNNTVIAGSSHGDGSGSSSTGGGSVGGPFGTTTAHSSRKADDGASRRGRYELSGFVLTLHYDDGRRERLLSFPVHGSDTKTIYVGNGSMSLDT